MLQPATSLHGTQPHRRVAVVGIAAGLYTALAYQWILMLVIVALVALILVASDVVGRTGA